MMKGWKMIHQETGIKIQARVVVLVSDREYFKLKLVKKQRSYI